MYIIRTIKNILKTKPFFFTTPGHFQRFNSMGEFGELFGRKIFNADLAEVEGMDNLQNPKGCIQDSLQRTSEIYGSKASFYLINGSSSGIIAMILSTVKRGEKILIARNAHKSVINALILSGAEPVWVETEWDDYWQIPTCVKPEKIAQKLEMIPDIKAVIVTSPTYEGVVSDIKSIARQCRKKNIILLVDEAHGALWNFSERLPDSSIKLGADICVQSIHKTGSCLNQGAILHISENSRLSPADIRQSLNLINTTSPSYLLLSSIEASIEYLNSKKGREKLDRLINNIEKIKNSVKNQTNAVFLESSPDFVHDPAKIFFGLEKINGQELSDFLQEKYNIEVEMNNHKGLLALTGIGTEKKHLVKLSKAIVKAAKKLKKSYENIDYKPYIPPEIAFTPAEAFYRDFEKIKLHRAQGRVSKETIVTYPPGIPIIIAGEVIQEEHLGALKRVQDIKVIK